MRLRLRARVQSSLDRNPAVGCRQVPPRRSGSPAARAARGAPTTSAGSRPPSSRVDTRAGLGLVARRAQPCRSRYSAAGRTSEKYRPDSRSCPASRSPSQCRRVAARRGWAFRPGWRPARPIRRALHLVVQECHSCDAPRSPTAIRPRRDGRGRVRVTRYDRPRPPVVTPGPPSAAEGAWVPLVLVHRQRHRTSR